MYQPRIAETQLKRKLEAVGAVLIEGPKACGKTETARQFAASEVLLDIDQQARDAVAVDPKLVLAGKTPRLIDEWQTEPTIWNHIRHSVDERKAKGQFILTGSAAPADDLTRHTGAGRISRLRLRTLSLYELGHSTGAVSLARLLRGDEASSPNPGHGIAEIAEQICMGGWPGNLRLTTRASLDAQRDYLEEIRRVDIRRVDGMRRDPHHVGRVLRSLARNSATIVAARTLALDAGGTDGPLDDNTVREYLNTLRRLRILEEQPSWSPHLRSRSILRNSPKRHFTDPSLAVAALGATPDALLKDLNLLGLLFESMVVRDLRIYAQHLDATLHHYRDNTGLEVDAVVESGSGAWCAFEIKLGAGRIDGAAAALLKFQQRVDTERTGAPQTLGVIVSHGYGYRRKDGVAVIPIGALGP